MFLVYRYESAKNKLLIAVCATREEAREEVHNDYMYMVDVDPDILWYWETIEDNRDIYDEPCRDEYD